MNDAAGDLYQDVVMDHKRSPRHFGALAQATHRARGFNPSCGDEIEVAVDLALVAIGAILLKREWEHLNLERTSRKERRQIAR